MKYVLNTGRYSFTFSLAEKNGLSRRIEFDRRRFFKDTGNLATNGITEVEDADYKALEAMKNFKRLLKEGTLALVDKPVSEAESQEQLKKKEREIAELKRKLEESKSVDVEALKKASEEKDTEISSLKEQLEALKKAASGGQPKDEQAGF